MAFDFDFEHRQTVYKYRFKDNEEVVSGKPKEFLENFGVDIKGEPGEVLMLNGREANYAGFEPQKTKLVTATEFEKNGRIGMRIVEKDGNVRYVSKTRMHYQKTGKVKHAYSKGFEEHLVKTKQWKMIHSDVGSKKGKATQVDAHTAMRGGDQDADKGGHIG